MAGELQYNADGKLIFHICDTSIPANIGSLMSDCCCDCDPARKEVYTVTWTQNAVAPSSQDYFWNDFYGYDRCNIFNDSSPFGVTYFYWKEVFNRCTWRSPNYHVNPGPLKWTYLDLQWDGPAGIWILYVGGSSGGSETALTTCTNPQLSFLGSPSKTDPCDPTGTYLPVGGLVTTDDRYGAGEVSLDISVVIS